MQSVRIGIVGDFDRGKHSHWATEAALFHAAARLEVAVEPRWVSTPLAAADPAAALAFADGVWGAPGSPFVSVQGMLSAIEHVRRSNKPYLGTCAGFQCALIELTRNLLGIVDADSAENSPEGEHIVITPVQCEVPQGHSGPRLSGTARVLIEPGSVLASLCRESELHVEYFCSYEINKAYEPRWREAGVRFGARGVDGAARALELPDHRFFLASLFQPQLSSSFDRPHPLVLGFLRASMGNR
jgi:CTP synthase (UTP-ammonia lyase)